MSRKTKIIQINDDGRDFGKAFVLTEMPAMRAEKWAQRAFFALSNANYQIPESVVQLGMLGVLYVGLNALANASFSDFEPLMDEMMTCVQWINPQNPDILPRRLIETDIEEVETILRLRREVLELHLGFTMAEGLSRLRASAMSSLKTTPTSPGSSEPSSPADGQP